MGTSATLAADGKRRGMYKTILVTVFNTKFDAQKPAEVVEFGYTFGFRFCSNLKIATGTTVPTTTATTAPADPDAFCPRRHMLPGMNNKVLSEGGAPCLLKTGHKGDCQIEIEQSTVTTRLAVSQDSEKPPRILSEVRKR